MKAITNSVFVLALLTIYAALTACVTATPTQTSTVVDDRPVIMFRFVNEKASAPVSIYLNEEYAGDATSFIEGGEYGLKIVSGTHFMRLEYKDKVALEKKFYIGDGSTKIIDVDIRY